MSPEQQQAYQQQIYEQQQNQAYAQQQMMGGEDGYTQFVGEDGMPIS
jgi:hypothetical protein